VHLDDGRACQGPLLPLASHRRLAATGWELRCTQRHRRGVVPTPGRDPGAGLPGPQRVGLAAQRLPQSALPIRAAASFAAGDATCV
jgi:hypothetical protein